MVSRSPDPCYASSFVSSSFLARLPYGNYVQSRWSTGCGQPLLSACIWSVPVCRKPRLHLEDTNNSAYSFLIDRRYGYHWPCFQSRWVSDCRRYPYEYPDSKHIHRAGHPPTTNNEYNQQRPCLQPRW